jgi:hypothetical protein
VALLETARPTVPGSARRWDDRSTGRPVIPAQRGPVGPRPVLRVAVSEVPAVTAPRRLEAPARRRRGLNPDLARVALAGVLLFGALVASMSTPPPVPDPPASGQHPAQVAHR